ncbi:molecular chaperone [Pseudomonas sp. Leaf58]|nr:molecular chaperone [Pseudomonas sp. Leaf58]KQN67422.1 hypothetical protein ASF02_06590 [Pseudomonas sp. Leaf58]
MCTVLPSARAALIVEGTRLIYSGSAREASISILNKSERGALVQSWVSEEEDNDKSDIPFAVAQPLVYLEPNGRHLLRVFYAGWGLPENKESVVWLNIMDIPPKPEHSEQSGNIQFAVRQRLKLFYRPPGLVGSTSDAIPKLVWKRLQHQKIQVNNPSLFHVSLIDLEVGAGTSRQKIADYVFLSPGETRMLEVPVSAFEYLSRISFKEITDGGLQNYHSVQLQ